MSRLLGEHHEDLTVSEARGVSRSALRELDLARGDGPLLLHGRLRDDLLVVGRDDELLALLGADYVYNMYVCMYIYIL